MTAVAVFDVLASPQRRQIVSLLRDGERSVTSLVDELSVAQPVVSKQLRVLRDAGFVEVRAAGQRRMYRLRSEPFAAVDAWLEPYRRLWDERLDALERHLEEMPSPTRRRRRR